MSDKKKPKSKTDKKGKSLKENQWKPGVSGNPSGRPKGSKNKSTLIKEVIEGDVAVAIGQDVVKVLQKAVEMALEGDGAMIKLIADKFVPNAKLEDDRGRGNGFGGINITISGMDTKVTPAINAEIIEEDENGNE